MNHNRRQSSLSLLFRLFKVEKKKKAYTLLELSIVLLVFSVLMGGGITATTSMINGSKQELTSQRMGAINSAIGRFVANNKRLPCPASLIVTDASDKYGREASSQDDDQNCMLRAEPGVFSSKDVRNIVYGAVPVKALGLSDDFAVDGFGSKLSYVVNSHLTIADERFISDGQLVQNSGTGRKGFGLYNVDSNIDESININQAASGNKIENLAFVVISHGPNQNGSYVAESSFQNNADTSSDDYVNVPKSKDGGIGTAIDRARFGSIIDGRLHLISSNESSSSFDDKLLFKSRSDIITEFNLAHLVPCVPDSKMKSGGFDKIVYLGGQVSGNSCQGAFSAIAPIKECGPSGYGNWIDKVNCPVGVAQGGSGEDTASDDGSVAQDDSGDGPDEGGDPIVIAGGSGDPVVMDSGDLSMGDVMFIDSNVVGP